MKNSIITIKNLSKFFKVPHEKRDTLKSYFTNPFKRISYEKFFALSDINLEIKEGEFVGFLGKNGSGKSTLLKLIASIYAPTSGKLKVHGSLVPFLELGVGFNQELTGRENIFLNGTILGMSRNYLEKKFDEIVDFAEISDFIDLQLKNYSSGMRMRLAFSIAIQSKADIFLLDEVLAVGDSAFQKKSLAKMRELLGSGATVLYVSHSMETVEKYCNRVVVIEGGKIIYDGETKKGIRAYQLSLLSEQQKTEFLRAEASINKYRESQGKKAKLMTLDKLDTVEALNVDRGDGRADILEVKMYGEKGKETKTLTIGEEFKVEVKFRVNNTIRMPSVGVSFRNNPAYPLFGIWSKLKLHNKEVEKLQRGEVVTATFTSKNLVNPGVYDLQVQVSDRSTKTAVSLYLSYFKFSVIGPDDDYWGMIYNKPKFEFKLEKS